MNFPFGTYTSFIPMLFDISSPAFGSPFATFGFVWKIVSPSFALLPIGVFESVSSR